MRKAQFETSKGIVEFEVCKTSEGYLVAENISEDGKKILDTLFTYAEVRVDEPPGWVAVVFEDSFYGSPEYKYTHDGGSIRQLNEKMVTFMTTNSFVS